jgi:hypothetical protein
VTLYEPKNPWHRTRYHVVRSPKYFLLCVRWSAMGLSKAGKNHRLRNQIAKALRVSPGQLRVTDPKRTDDKDRIA